MLATLSVIATPYAAGPINGNASVCRSSGGFVYSVDPIVNASGYKWTLPAGFSGSSLSYSININVSDSVSSGNIRVAGMNGVCIGKDTVLAIAINSFPIVSQNPMPVSICSGNNAVFSAVASGTSLNYQWQLSSDGGTSWNDIISAGSSPVYANWNTDSLQLGSVQTDINGYQYRCLINSAGNCPDTTAPALITVNGSPVITNEPLANYAYIGNSTGFRTVATGAGAYQWQVSADAGTSWSDISSSGSNPMYGNWDQDSLIVSNVQSVNNNYLYRCAISNSSNCYDTSNVVKLNVFTQYVNGAFRVIHDFVMDNDLSTPVYNDLVTDGTWLYGMTPNGGSANLGAIFKIKTDGSGYTKLLDFDGANRGSLPHGSLTISGSTLFGMTSAGGTNALGVIFKMNMDGTGFTKLLDFDNSSGASPQGSLTISGSTLFGMNYVGGANGGGVIFKINTDGTGFTKLLDFDGTNSGSNPQGSLILSGSSLYGMTYVGGANGGGVIFKINTDATGFTKLLDFDGAHGSNPYGSLVLSGTTLYGMTNRGGANNYGVIFKINTDNTNFTVILDFDGYTTGYYPYGSLVISSSYLYGMTYGGVGLVFGINTDGTGFNILVDFGKTNHGSYPMGSLALSASTLFGMTSQGGASNSGVVFKINSDGSRFSTLLNMSSGISGYKGGMNAQLVSDGTWMYGMTSGGGKYASGVIYKIKPDGSLYTKIMDFDGTNSGSNPQGSLVLSGSTLYGMTSNGGSNNYGTIFSIYTDGTEFNKLLDFDGTNSGSNPQGSLICQVQAYME